MSAFLRIVYHMPPPKHKNEKFRVFLDKDSAGFPPKS